MTEEQIPQRVRTFIADHIESVVQLEVLLFLQADQRRECSCADIARELRIAPDWAESQLVKLRARGLLASEAGAEQLYRYAPRSPDLDEAVRGLAEAYTDYRVTVTSLIFAKPSDQLRSFADAFRIRNTQSDG